MVNKRMIQNQQMVLKALGFYTGKCDGFWSKLTIEAKKQFESDPSFKPAYPNNGMPFELGVSSKLPHGIYFDPRRPGFITTDKLTSDRVNEWEGDLVEPYDNRKESVKSQHVEQPVSDSDNSIVEQEPVEESDQLDPVKRSTSEAQTSTNHNSDSLRKKKHRK